MPEYPDITIYIERLTDLLQGQQLENIRFNSAFFLRTARPPISDIKGGFLKGFKRMGKRIVFVFAKDRFLVLHLMIAGRLHWRERQCKITGKMHLAALDFPNGSLLVTEAGTQKRASLHFVAGHQALSALDPGGLEIFEASLETFGERLISENHTLKRALTDPHLFSGIGNAYSDEILHRACLSPLQLTQNLNHEQIGRLFKATQETLELWTRKIREDTGDKFPEKVTAFRSGMAVHGRYKQPCPVCETAIQRIRYVKTETNYCPRCQTGGKLLADRAMSRLLKKDWPRTLEELEIRKSKVSKLKQPES